MHLIKSISGLRGIADPSYGLEVTVTPQLAGDVGRALGTYLARTGRPTRDGVRWLIGARDGRPGGHALLDALACGAWECGARVISLGVATTPTVGFAVAEFSQTVATCGGVVITASHNPQQWNGVKLLLDGGRAPAPADAEGIFALLDRGDFDLVNDDQPPPSEHAPDIGDLHVSRVVEQVDADRIRARRFRVVLDSINGAGSRPGRMLLESLGCEVTHLNSDPDTPFGRNPEPVGENLTDLREAVVKHQADIGFAQDPDGDRLAVVDEHGRCVGEEYTLALAAKHVLATRPGPVVANLSTSRMIDDLARAAGGPCVVHRSAVGETHVVDLMHKVGAHLGGEGNGGVIDPRVVYVRDSIGSIGLVLQLLADEGKPISQIVDELPRYTIVKHKFDCTRDRTARILDKVRTEFAKERIIDVDGVRVDRPEGWVHVRGSNTEPIMRIIAEAADEQTAQALVARVRSIAEGVV